MAQKKDNTKKLKSISTGDLCSAAQYVAEVVCLRKAEKDNTGSLEYKFWNKSKISHSHKKSLSTNMAQPL